MADSSGSGQQGSPTKKRRVGRGDSAAGGTDTSGADHVGVHTLLRAYMTLENAYTANVATFNMKLVDGWDEKRRQDGLPFTLGYWKEFHANPRWIADTAPDDWAEQHARIDALISAAAKHHLQQLRQQQARTAGAGAAAAGAGYDAGAGAAEDNNPDDTAAVESVGDYDCPLSLAGSMPMFPAGTTISHAAFQLCTLQADVRIKFNHETVAFAAFVEAARTGATEGESKAAAGPAPANSSGATEDESKAAAGPAPANSSGAGAARIAAAAAAHLLSTKCAGVNLVELAAIVARKPAEEPSPDCDIKDSVWEIEHVRNTAARVLSASVCTPAGILLSALLKVGANPALELDRVLLLAVEAYITTTAPDSWKKEPTQTHAWDAFSVAGTLTNKRIRYWSKQHGELALECLQVGPIVRRPLEAVFDTLHCNVALPASTLIARVRTEAGPGGAGQGTSIRTGGWLQVRPDITVQPGARAVLALGETKLKPKLRTDNFKLACMSAAACGALQMKIRMLPTGDSPSHGRCHCGERESLFPIPLIESYENVLKLYYGKTWHDEKDGKCEHRVGCFFSLEMDTWADALLALSVMQAAANDMKDRWDAMLPGHRLASDNRVPGLVTMAAASTAASTTVRGTTQGTSEPQDGAGAGAGGDGTGTNHAKRTATLHADMAALRSAGVAGVKTLFAMPVPVVAWEAGCTPSTSDWNCPRVYHGTWTHNGAARAVVVKVVSRSQAADEVAVLEAVGARKQARAIQVLAQIPVNDGDVGLVTPYCPGKLFEGAPSLHHVLRQAIQLCEAVMAWHAAGVLHLDLKPANIATAAGDVVVLDAGISRFMTDGSVAVRGAVGTRGYMAPELRDDGRHVAVPACDVYSLGMTYRRALDRWASTERRSTTRADAPQPSSSLTQLRAMCEAMCRDDAAKRTPLPEVLAVLKALASPDSGRPRGGSPGREDYPRKLL